MLPNRVADGGLVVLGLGHLLQVGVERFEAFEAGDEALEGSGDVDLSHAVFVFSQRSG